jgi:hypothetical protein
MIELYRFWLHNTSTGWEYTTNSSSINFQGRTYTPLAIKRTEVSTDFAKNTAVLEMPYSVEPAILFQVNLSYGSLWLEIIKYPEEDKIFVGRVMGCVYKMKRALAILKLEAIQAIFSTMIPADTFSTACRFQLFDANCTVVSSSYVVSAPTDEIVVDERKITHTNFGTKPSGWFTNGKVVVGVEEGLITKHSGNDITLIYPLQTLTDSLTLNAYAGCDKTIDDCQNKFSNEANYGGFMFIPEINPVLEGW